MTESELYTSITLVTLLIVGLMGWLKGEFAELSKTVPSWNCQFNEHGIHLVKPKRRKHRDNPTRGK